MSWRLYARRRAGAWLDTDVQMELKPTWGLNGATRGAAVLPYAMLRPSSDGYPFWLERSTVLYAEQDSILRWVGLLDFARPANEGLQLEFKGYSAVYDLIGFDGRIREWSPDPYDVVERLLANAHAQPDGNAGFTVLRDGPAARTAGDPAPDVVRPPKPPRRKNESAEHYDDRLLTWEEAVDEWERLYGGREPYALADWEAQYVGAEIAELADEIPFTYTERHSWTNRAALAASHELVLAADVTERRPEILLEEGTNVVSVLEPETDTTVYGNHAVVLGAGEGSAMKTAQVGSTDGRFRTTRYAELKSVKSQQRLRTAAANLLRASRSSAVLKATQVAPRVGQVLRVGDEVRVASKRFTGWCRISEITTSTLGAPYDLEFDRTTDGVIL